MEINTSAFATSTAAAAAVLRPVRTVAEVVGLRPSHDGTERRPATNGGLKAGAGSGAGDGTASGANASGTTTATAAPLTQVQQDVITRHLEPAPLTAFLHAPPAAAAKVDAVVATTAAQPPLLPHEGGPVLGSDKPTAFPPRQETTGVALGAEVTSDIVVSEDGHIVTVGVRVFEVDLASTDPMALLSKHKKAHIAAYLKGHAHHVTKIGRRSPVARPASSTAQNNPHDGSLDSDDDENDAAPADTRGVDRETVRGLDDGVVGSDRSTDGSASSTSSEETLASSSSSLSNESLRRSLRLFGSDGSAAPSVEVASDVSSIAFTESFGILPAKKTSSFAANVETPTVVGALHPTKAQPNGGGAVIGHVSLLPKSAEVASAVVRYDASVVVAVVTDAFALALDAVSKRCDYLRFRACCIRAVAHQVPTILDPHRRSIDEEEATSRSAALFYDDDTAMNLAPGLVPLPLLAAAVAPSHRGACAGLLAAAVHCGLLTAFVSDADDTNTTRRENGGSPRDRRHSVTTARKRKHHVESEDEDAMLANNAAWLFGDDAVDDAAFNQSDTAISRSNDQAVETRRKRVFVALTPHNADLSALQSHPLFGLHNRTNTSSPPPPPPPTATAGVTVAPVGAPTTPPPIAPRTAATAAAVAPSAPSAAPGTQGAVAARPPATGTVATKQALRPPSATATSIVKPSMPSMLPQQESAAAPHPSAPRKLSLTVTSAAKAPPVPAPAVAAAPLDAAVPVKGTTAVPSAQPAQATLGNATTKSQNDPSCRKVLHPQVQGGSSVMLPLLPSLDYLVTIAGRCLDLAFATAPPATQTKPTEDKECDQSPRPPSANQGQRGKVSTRSKHDDDDEDNAASSSSSSSYDDSTSSSDSTTSTSSQSSTSLSGSSLSSGGNEAIPQWRVVVHFLGRAIPLVALGAASTQPTSDFATAVQEVLLFALSVSPSRGAAAAAADIRRSIETGAESPSTLGVLTNGTLKARSAGSSANGARRSRSRSASRRSQSRAAVEPSLHLSKVLTKSGATTEDVLLAGCIITGLFRAGSTVSIPNPRVGLLPGMPIPDAAARSASNPAPSNSGASTTNKTAQTTTAQSSSSGATRPAPDADPSLYVGDHQCPLIVGVDKAVVAAMFVQAFSDGESDLACDFLKEPQFAAVRTAAIAAERTAMTFTSSASTLSVSPGGVRSIGGATSNQKERLQRKCAVALRVLEESGMTVTVSGPARMDADTTVDVVRWSTPVLRRPVVQLTMPTSALPGHASSEPPSSRPTKKPQQIVPLTMAPPVASESFDLPPTDVCRQLSVLLPTCADFHTSPSTNQPGHAAQDQAGQEKPMYRQLDVSGHTTLDRIVSAVVTLSALPNITAEIDRLFQQWRQCLSPATMCLLDPQRMLCAFAMLLQKGIVVLNPRIVEQMETQRLESTSGRGGAKPKNTTTATVLASARQPMASAAEAATTATGLFVLSAVGVARASLLPLSVPYWSAQLCHDDLVTAALEADRVVRKEPDLTLARQRLFSMFKQSPTSSNEAAGTGSTTDASPRLHRMSLGPFEISAALKGFGGPGAAPFATTRLDALLGLCLCGAFHAAAPEHRHRKSATPLMSPAAISFSVGLTAPFSAQSSPHSLVKSGVVGGSGVDGGGSSPFDAASTEQRQAQYRWAKGRLDTLLHTESQLRRPELASKVQTSLSATSAGSSGGGNDPAFAAFAWDDGEVRCKIRRFVKRSIAAKIQRSFTETTRRAAVAAAERRLRQCDAALNATVTAISTGLKSEIGRAGASAGNNALGEMISNPRHDALTKELEVLRMKRSNAAAYLETARSMLTDDDRLDEWKSLQSVTVASLITALVESPNREGSRTSNASSVSGVASEDHARAVVWHYISTGFLAFDSNASTTTLNGLPVAAASVTHASFEESLRVFIADNDVDTTVAADQERDRATARIAKRATAAAARSKHAAVTPATNAAAKPDQQHHRHDQHGAKGRDHHPRTKPASSAKTPWRRPLTFEALQILAEEYEEAEGSTPAVRHPQEMVMRGDGAGADGGDDYAMPLAVPSHVPGETGEQRQARLHQAHLDAKMRRKIMQGQARVEARAHAKPDGAVATVAAAKQTKTWRASLPLKTSRANTKPNTTTAGAPTSSGGVLLATPMPKSFVVAVVDAIASASATAARAGTHAAEENVAHRSQSRSQSRVRDASRVTAEPRAATVPLLDVVNAVLSTTIPFKSTNGAVAKHHRSAGSAPSTNDTESLRIAAVSTITRLAARSPSITATVVAAAAQCLNAVTVPGSVAGSSDGVVLHPGVVSSTPLDSSTSQLTKASNEETVADQAVALYEELCSDLVLHKATAARGVVLKRMSGEIAAARARCALKSKAKRRGTAANDANANIKRGRDGRDGRDVKSTRKTRNTADASGLIESDHDVDETDEHKSGVARPPKSKREKMQAVFARRVAREAKLTATERRELLMAAFAATVAAVTNSLGVPSSAERQCTDTSASRAEPSAVLRKQSRIAAAQQRIFRRELLTATSGGSGEQAIGSLGMRPSMAALTMGQHGQHQQRPIVVVASPAKPPVATPAVVPPPIAPSSASPGLAGVKSVAGPKPRQDAVPRAVQAMATKQPESVKERKPATVPVPHQTTSVREALTSIPKDAALPPAPVASPPRPRAPAPPAPTFETPPTLSMSAAPTAAAATKAPVVAEEKAASIPAAPRDVDAALPDPLAAPRLDTVATVPKHATPVPAPATTTTTAEPAQSQSGKLAEALPEPAHNVVSSVSVPEVPVAPQEEAETSVTSPRSSEPKGASPPQTTVAATQVVALRRDLSRGGAKPKQPSATTSALTTTAEAQPNESKNDEAAVATTEAVRAVETTTALLKATPAQEQSPKDSSPKLQEAEKAPAPKPKAKKDPRFVFRTTPAVDEKRGRASEGQDTKRPRDEDQRSKRDAGPEPKSGPRDHVEFKDVKGDSKSVSATRSTRSDETAETIMPLAIASNPPRSSPHVGYGHAPFVGGAPAPVAVPQPRNVPMPPWAEGGRVAPVPTHAAMSEWAHPTAPPAIPAGWTRVAKPASSQTSCSPSPPPVVDVTRAPPAAPIPAPIGFGDSGADVFGGGGGFGGPPGVAELPAVPSIFLRPRRAPEPPTVAVPQPEVDVHDKPAPTAQASAQPTALKDRPAPRTEEGERVDECERLTDDGSQKRTVDATEPALHDSNAGDAAPPSTSLETQPSVEALPALPGIFLRPTAAASSPTAPPADVLSVPPAVVAPPTRFLSMRTVPEDVAPPLSPSSMSAPARSSGTPPQVPAMSPPQSQTPKPMSAGGPVASAEVAFLSPPVAVPVSAMTSEERRQAAKDAQALLTKWHKTWMENDDWNLWFEAKFARRVVAECVPRDEKAFEADAAGRQPTPAVAMTRIRAGMEPWKARAVTMHQIPRPDSDCGFDIVFHPNATAIELIEKFVPPAPDFASPKAIIRAQTAGLSQQELHRIVMTVSQFRTVLSARFSHTTSLFEAQFGSDGDAVAATERLVSGTGLRVASTGAAVALSKRTLRLRGSKIKMLVELGDVDLAALTKVFGVFGPTHTESNTDGEILVTFTDDTPARRLPRSSLPPPPKTPVLDGYATLGEEDCAACLKALQFSLLWDFDVLLTRAPALHLVKPPKRTPQPSSPSLPASARPRAALPTTRAPHVGGGSAAEHRRDVDSDGHAFPSPPSARPRATAATASTPASASASATQSAAHGAPTTEKKPNGDALDDDDDDDDDDDEDPLHRSGSGRHLTSTSALFSSAAMEAQQQRGRNQKRRRPADPDAAFDERLGMGGEGSRSSSSASSASANQGHGQGRRGRRSRRGRR